MDFKHFCNDGADYFQLYISCPVCLEHNVPTTPSYWTHGTTNTGSECGGDMYIGDNGYYYCERCGHMDLIVNWAYKCPNPIHNQNGMDAYISVTDGKYIGKAISIAGQITGIAGIKWLNKLTSALLTQDFGSK